MSPEPNLRPQPPLAKRLNRNALIVAAVLMGFTVLTAVVVLNPAREKGAADQTAGAARAPTPGRPTFLDEPVQLESLPRTAPNGEPAPAPQRPVRPRRTYRAASAGPGPEPNTGLGMGREQLFQAALRSSVVAGGSERPAASSDLDVSQGLGSAEDRLIALGDSLMGNPQHAPAKAGVSPDRAKEFLTRAGNVGGGGVIARLQPAGSRYTLLAGTVIPGVLLTAINSDLPGEIVAQVSRNVYDSRTQQILLLPKGAKLIGTYGNQVAAGQGRLLVAWTRLILPDGRSLTLPGLALKDPEGQTGAAGRVDHHFQRVFGQALLLSAISAGAQLSQPRQNSVFATPSAGQVAAGALGQELSSVALEIIRRGMDVPPTVTVRQGQAFLVFLNGDLVFDGPYVSEP